MYTEEQLRDTWKEAIAHAEDRLSGTLPVFKTFDEWKGSLVKESDSLPCVSGSLPEGYCKYCGKTPCERKGVSIYPEDDEE